MPDGSNHQESTSADQVPEYIAHYRILRRLGKGGMGEVFLAEDTKQHGRKVALKVLPEELTRSESRLRRFRQEARAVLALNHPNILTVYEIGETDNSYYIATEYIEGETLRNCLWREPLRARRHRNRRVGPRATTVGRDGDVHLRRASKAELFGFDEHPDLSGEAGEVKAPDKEALWK